MNIMKQLSKSRREFIGDAAALSVLGAIGAGHLLSSCQAKREGYEMPVFLDKAPDGHPLRAGLIGCGGRGTGAAFNFLNAGNDLQITALGDVFQDRLDIARNSLKEQRDVDIPDQNCFVGFDAYKRVLDTDVDVVLLTTPPHFRPEHFNAAVQARKHAFVEKPVAVDPVGARSVMASAKMAESAGLSVVAGTQLRHNRVYNANFAMIKNGAIGRITGGEAHRLSGGSSRAPVIPEELSEMEEMLRNWTAWTWLSGNSWVENFVHHIDVLNWFFEEFPSEAVGLGGRYRRNYGNGFNFFSVEYSFDGSKKYNCMSRQMSGSYTRPWGHTIYGTKGYTDCAGQIWDYDDNLLWEYEYPLDEDGQPIRSFPVTMNDQSHINLVTAIRTNNPVNEAHTMASSSLVAIMGRESAYTAQLVTWDDMMNSELRLGPAEYKMGPVNIPKDPPIPGTD
jgi:myo-inositol 2-dehydrogenase / D-chiro-inositol 1-dehydrogenase